MSKPIEKWHVALPLKIELICAEPTTSLFNGNLKIHAINFCEFFFAHVLLVV
jgi:hypothetical protein